MKKKHLIATVVAAMLLSSCHEGGKGSATPQAAAEFANIQQMALDSDDPLDIEWQSVIEHFEKHMDVHFQSAQQRLTILHIAALCNKAELVRCLLLDGADANIPALMGDTETTPIELAMADGENADSIIATIDVLLQGGAKPELKNDIAESAISLCEHEAAALHLLKQLPTDTTAQENVLAIAAWKGWTDTLRFLLQRHTHDPNQLNKALFIAAAGSFRAEASAIDCINLLLQRGADINFTDEAGRTPLFAAATTLLQADESEAPRIISVVLHLLQAGADASITSQDEEYPGCSAYDVLRIHPTALSQLAKQGQTLQAPPLTFAPGTGLLSDICKAKQRGQKAEETLRHFDAIAHIFSPTQDMKDSGIYPEALENAIVLLSEADSRKTAQLIADMSIRQSPDAWTEHEHTTQALLSGIRQAPAIILPAQLLQQTSQKFIQLGLNDEAATLIEWLGRDESASESIEQAQQDTHPAIRAGAWAAKLLNNNLPMPRNGEIQRWMEQHPELDKNHPALQNALMLTSLEELWYGNMPRQKQQKLIACMREIGAPQAANQYEKIAANLHNADVLDEIMSQPDDWKFELEIATAQYIWQHQDAFLYKNKENTD